MSRSDLVATAKLRWVERKSAPGDDFEYLPAVLQQFWAPDVPTYLQNDHDGEWRDVYTVIG